MSMQKNIFRAYDIRGAVPDELNANNIATIAKAIALIIKENKQQEVVIARDGRISGPSLLEAIAVGLTSFGINVTNLGAVPTPLLYYATKKLSIPNGIMLTGSHNPVNYNGLKMIINDEPCFGQQITRIYELAQNLPEKADFIKGTITNLDITNKYISEVAMHLKLDKATKIVIDSGNGIAGSIAPRLYRELGAEVFELYSEVDGNFPNHHPDPGQPKNLVDLSNKVQEVGADLGIAFDGDGDRLGVVDADGNIIWPDRYSMLLAQEVLANNPGASIIFDVKCSSACREIINHNHGKPIISCTGHSLIKDLMKKTNALLAFEMSGHIFYKDKWYGFDDALYAGARLLKTIEKSDLSATQQFETIPKFYSTPEIAIPLADDLKFGFIEKLKALAQKVAGNNEVITIDGLRIDYSNGWGLIRPSNTTPNLIARFEGNDESTLNYIINEFQQLLDLLTPNIKIKDYHGT